ncbi:uncharacterized protein EDB93DRAFT_872587 [Suillus bovinus]|uniref:uncharacterized protein n=1 Tax=Suillus bovinus TaxID=48563 RepID=UPI001B88718E|nr:uncharacterized protein EDB93DRAFT_872587 [Suillus bovinus]KAG2156859.1 hypothetical protein EDB93DRAFT_872587 [Suillus bovinus]
MHFSFILAAAAALTTFMSVSARSLQRCLSEGAACDPNEDIPAGQCCTKFVCGLDPNDIHQTSHICVKKSGKLSVFITVGHFSVSCCPNGQFVTRYAVMIDMLIATRISGLPRIA